MTETHRGREIDDLLLEYVRRAAAFRTLDEGSISASDLQRELDVSQPTVHRVLSSLREQGLVDAIDGEYQLTPSGRLVAEGIERYSDHVRTVLRLEPLLALTDLGRLEFDPARFEDATVTVADPEDPYAPFRRFFELFEATTSLRIMHEGTHTPAVLDTYREAVADGTSLEFLYEEANAETNLRLFDEHAPTVLESASTSFWRAEEVPAGLALFDDHVALGGDDPETGTLAVAVDSDDADAVRWVERVYERHRARATDLDDRLDQLLE